MMDAIRDTSQLQFGPGSELWDYWTKGKGLARWAGAEHKWTVLNELLREAGVPAHEVDGLTTNIIEHVFPGYMKQAHAKGLKRMSGDDEAGRATMTARDINDLPDSAFAYIEPGGTKDEQGKTTPRSKRHFPVHDAAHVRNALARAPQSPFGDKAMPAIRKAAKKFKIGEYAADAQRAARLEMYARSWALDGIEILRAGDGHSDGRTVEAYATPFDVSTEITDQHGHYNEVIDRTAFNRTLKHGIDRVGVYYHHALTLHGTPSDLGSVPIGSPLEITPDGRGLRTVTRYNRSALADSVLEAIRNGDIKGYSFRGRIFRSNPSRVPRARSGGSLPTVRRMELGLTEYGPTPTPAYRDAGILAVRSKLDEISEEIAELTRTISPSTPLDPDGSFATPDPGPGAEDPREAHSVRQQMLRLRRQLRERGL